MSEVDELKNSIKKEIEECDEFLERTKNIVHLVPFIQERKQEAEAKYTALNVMPEDVLSELAPKLLPVQLSEQKRLEDFLPRVPQVDSERTQHYLVSGSTAAFYETMITPFPSELGVPVWVVPASKSFDLLAQQKAKKNTLPSILDKLKQNLGGMFTIADESFEKSKGGILGVDQAAIQMRDVIQQVWVGLTNHTKRKCPKDIKGQHLELKKTAHREIVANCLAISQENRNLQLLLDNLFDLHSKLSSLCKESR